MACKVEGGTKVSLIRGQAALGYSPIPEGVIGFNFAHVDAQQGQSFADWEAKGQLSQMLTRFKDHGTKTVAQCFHPRSFKSYGAFPPKTDFSHPRHISPDVTWASMHLDAKTCVGGYLVKNIFFVVFLDENHRFWIAEKKHT